VDAGHKAGHVEFGVCYYEGIDEQEPSHSRIKADASGRDAARGRSAGRLFSNSPDLWINLERAHDRIVAERAFASKLKKIPTLAAA
jgi:hypothetical protein